MSNSLNTIILRVTIGGRTFAVKRVDGDVSYRDLTSSKTGTFVTEKQSTMLEDLCARMEKLAAAAKLPVEKAAPAAKPTKVTKAAPAAKTRAAKAKRTK